MADDFGVVGLQRNTGEVIGRVGKPDVGTQDVGVEALEQRHDHRARGDQQVAVADPDDAKHAEHAPLGRRITAELKARLVELVDVVAQLVLQKIGGVVAAHENQSEFVGAANEILPRERAALLRAEILPLFHRLASSWRAIAQSR